MEFHVNGDKTLFSYKLQLFSHHIHKPIDDRIDDVYPRRCKFSHSLTPKLMMMWNDKMQIVKLKNNFDGKMKNVYARWVNTKLNCNRKMCIVIFVNLFRWEKVRDFLLLYFEEFANFQVINRFNLFFAFYELFLIVNCLIYFLNNFSFFFSIKIIFILINYKFKFFPQPN